MGLMRVPKALNDRNGHRTSKLSEPRSAKVVDLKSEEAVEYLCQEY
jgi:hypothetical protein